MSPEVQKQLEDSLAKLNALAETRNNPPSAPPAKTQAPVVAAPAVTGPTGGFKEAIEAAADPTALNQTREDVRPYIVPKGKNDYAQFVRDMLLGKLDQQYEDSKYARYNDDLMRNDPNRNLNGASATETLAWQRAADAYNNKIRRQFGYGPGIMGGLNGAITLNGASRQDERYQNTVNSEEQRQMQQFRTNQAALQAQDINRADRYKNREITTLEKMDQEFLREQQKEYDEELRINGKISNAYIERQNKAFENYYIERTKFQMQEILSKVGVPKMQLDAILALPMGSTAQNMLGQLYNGVNTPSPTQALEIAELVRLAESGLEPAEIFRRTTRMTTGWTTDKVRALVGGLLTVVEEGQGAYKAGDLADFFKNTGIQ
jgi:hypothetical protein